MIEFQTLEKLVADAKEEVQKVTSAKGNKAASRRLRIKMQEVKKAAQAVRLAVASMQKVE